MTFHMGISWSQLTNSYLRGRSSTSYIIPNKMLNNFPWRSSHSHGISQPCLMTPEDKFSGEQARIFSRVECRPADSPLSVQDGRTLKLYIHRPAGGCAPLCRKNWWFHRAQIGICNQDVLGVFIFAFLESRLEGFLSNVNYSIVDISRYMYSKWGVINWQAYLGGTTGTLVMNYIQPQKHVYQ